FSNSISDHLQKVRRRYRIHHRSISRILHYHPTKGKILQVLKSGLRYISDSSTRTNPSIEDPSNIISPSSALPSWVVGISTFLIVPRISVNCSLTYLTFSDSAILKISSLEYSSISLTRPYIIENIVHLKLSSAQILIYPLACFRSYKHYTEK